MSLRHRDALLAFGMIVSAISSPAPAAETWADRLNVDNLVPYEVGPAAWSDEYSNINLSWKHPKKSGLQQLVVLTGFWGEVPTDSLLEWTLTEDGKPLPLQFKSRTYRPDHVTEISAADSVEVTAVAVFPTRNAIGVELRIRNRLNAVREVDLSFRYPAKGIRSKWTGPRPYGRTTSIADEPPDDNWSLATAIELLLQRYKEHR